MKLFFRASQLALLCLFLCSALACPPCQAVEVRGVEPIDLNGATVGKFWKDHYRRLAVEWLPHCIRQMEQGGRGQELLNLINTGKLLAGQEHGEFTGLPWADAYVYNTVESICLALTIQPGSDDQWATAQHALRAKLNEWVPIILAAQEDSGYIHSFHALKNHPHYQQIADHEFYVMGYFLDMAVAHYRLMGDSDDRLYRAAVRLADHLDATFGPAPKRTWKNGHAGLEYSLCRLARLVNQVQGNQAGDKYYRLSKHFLDHQHELEPNPYNQSERAAVTMRDASGHAVRATYFYTAMADMALLGDNPDYLGAVDRLWDSAIQRKHYLTGGVGSSHHGEAFGPDYDLRNNGYCESCASCGMGFWADRMHRIHGGAHYHDVFERLIYNNVLGALELTGKNFFYQNPLSAGNARYPWHGCPCCVGNIPRALMMLKDVAYAADPAGETLYVNHYLDSQATLSGLADSELTLTQQTNYPWSGDVKLLLNAGVPVELTLKLRIPDRTESNLYTATPNSDGKYQVRVNGESVDAKLVDGYAELKRTWSAGDTIQLQLPMEVQRVHCDPRVEANRGCVAVMRGPIVYNFENVDHPVEVQKLVLPADVELESDWQADLLGGVMVVRTQGVSVDNPEAKLPLVAVPNYARLNRGGHTQVWMRESAPQVATE